MKDTIALWGTLIIAHNYFAQVEPHPIMWGWLWLGVALTILILDKVRRLK